MTKILLAHSVVKSLRQGCVFGGRVGNTSALLRLQTTKLFSVKVGNEVWVKTVVVSW